MKQCGRIVPEERDEEVRDKDVRNVDQKLNCVFLLVGAISKKGSKWDELVRSASPSNATAISSGFVKILLLSDKNLLNSKMTRTK